MELELNDFPWSEVSNESGKCHRMCVSELIGTDILLPSYYWGEEYGDVSLSLYVCFVNTIIVSNLILH